MMQSETHLTLTSTEGDIHVLETTMCTFGINCMYCVLQMVIVSLDTSM